MTKFVMGDVRRTITSMFMLPLLKIPTNLLLDNGFINAYSYDTLQEESIDRIYVLMKPDNFSKFRDFIQNEYDRTSALIDDYDYAGGYVVLVYKLPEEFANDFQLIRQGKYSKTSIKYQNSFPKILKIKVAGLHRDELSLQYRIFNKAYDLVEFWEEQFGMEFNDEFELWENFSKEKETIDIEKIREYEKI